MNGAFWTVNGNGRPESRDSGDKPKSAEFHPALTVITKLNLAPRAFEELSDDLREILKFRVARHPFPANFRIRVSEEC
jgi:hypothetical protein